MKTLQQIKDEFARSKGYISWADVYENVDIDYFFELENEVMILVQKECLENANKQLSIDECGFYGRDFGVTNENNIIK